MTSLLVLAGLGAALVVLGVVTARPPAVEVPDLDGYFDRWQTLHADYDPRSRSVWLRWWLTGVHAIGGPLARRGVWPDVLTIASLWLALLVVALADLGDHWVAAAGLVLVASGLGDNLDGCVAVLEERTTAWGYVLDSVVDRGSDALYLVALVLVGCPVWLAVGCGFACFLLEYVRSRAAVAAGEEVELITIAERPTRVIVPAAGLLLAGALPASADGIATADVAVLLTMTAFALVQLGAAVRRQLIGGSGGTDEPGHDPG